ncbi:hypothetical protein BY996DRAFT_4587187 [Phakopsora pachyrhizi]|nr:hypothetical protein BY996DRAFT_4587187 [Phakopsora pachyrhizi]
MMTSLDDEKVIGEIGWGMQAIHDNTKQKVIPKYWRPPYGDIDDRVRAIAKHVFGLETILWDQDPKDWCLSDQNPGASACATGRGPQTLKDLETKYKSYANENIKKGMLSLHHETSVRPIQAYKKLYSELKSKGWAIKNIPDMLNKPWYQA